MSIRTKQPTGISDAGTGINRLPPVADIEPDVFDGADDTDPEPFGVSDRNDTAKRCYQCGRDQADTFAAGKTWTVRALRKWLATRMSAGEAIAVTSEFVRRL